MHAVDGAVAQLLSAEVTPVNIGELQVDPAVGIVGHIGLNKVILEEDDVGQGAQIAGGAGQGHGLFHIAGAGLGGNLEFEVGVDLLIGSLGSLQRGDVEVCVPGIDGQGVVSRKRGPGHGHKREDHGQDEEQGKQFLHDFSSVKNNVTRRLRTYCDDFIIIYDTEVTVFNEKTGSFDYLKFNTVRTHKRGKQLLYILTVHKTESGFRVNAFYWLAESQPRWAEML